MPNALQISSMELREGSNVGRCIPNKASKKNSSKNKLYFFEAQLWVEHHALPLKAEHFTTRHICIFYILQ